MGFGREVVDGPGRATCWELPWMVKSGQVVHVFACKQRQHLVLGVINSPAPPDNWSWFLFKGHFSKPDSGDILFHSSTLVTPGK